MKAIDEVAAVPVFAARIVGALIGRTMRPVAPDGGGASRSGTYPATAWGKRLNAYRKTCQADRNRIPMRTGSPSGSGIDDAMGCRSAAEPGYKAKVRK
ncbi:hypothetical protein [Accumulibacter sp.]|uniref:hypothetical protein n=1 Tax=Accumulibacter sp. TaxID=2053492 RepID=UPI0026340A6B|nr:hypothetical protein [Accumulibacter sp.]